MEFNLKFVLFTKFLLIFNIAVAFFGDIDVNKEDMQKGKKLQELNEQINIKNPLTNWDRSYERTIRYIKEHEGFAGGKTYICPGGYPTVGYGHVILKGEHFGQLSKKQADSLLRVDFNKALNAVERVTDIQGNKKLSIAHFVFTRGIGTYIKSELKKKVENGENIEDELLKWSYYRNPKGEKIISKHALNIRKWELKLYNIGV